VLSVFKVFFTSIIDISVLLVPAFFKLLFNTLIVVCSILQNSPKSSSVRIVLSGMGLDLREMLSGNTRMHPFLTVYRTAP
jgi:hypothetical protein